MPEDLGAWFFCLQIDQSAGHTDGFAGLPEVWMHVREAAHGVVGDAMAYAIESLT